MSVFVTAAYAFFPVPELDQLQSELIQFGRARDMKGLILIATEGINATVCGTPIAMEEWKLKLRSLHPEILFKDSIAEKEIFKRWVVKIKPEIVALKKSDIRPAGEHRHISPEAWNRLMQEDDVVVLDTRNDYEVAIGKFANAVDPKIRSFQEFPAYVRNSGIPRSKKVLLYCTGGIRCEKAILAMEAEGYADVYQLEGGILNYLEKFPHQNFKGECFVFDDRVAVDQELKPTKTFRPCPCCGDPVAVV